MQGLGSLLALCCVGAMATAMEGVPVDDYVTMCPTKDPPRVIDGRHFRTNANGFCGDLWIAFTTLGFARVHHHGIKPELIERAFDKAKQYFSLPSVLKDQTIMTEDFTSGYRDRDRLPLWSNDTNHREIFHFNRAYIKRHPELLPDANYLPEFEQTFNELEDALYKVASKFLFCIGDRTGFMQEYFDELIARNDHENSLSHLQLAHYYPIDAADVASGRAPEYRLQPHTDWSLLTLTIQEENNGGVDVLCGTDEDDKEKFVYIDIPAEKYVLTINAGDMLSRWMEGGFRSTQHRILTAKNTQGDQPDRHSLAYFVYPHRQAVLESVAHTRIPIRTEEYLQRKHQVKASRSIDDDLVQELLNPDVPEKEDDGPPGEASSPDNFHQQHDEL
jgi:isopenicillin N synthase-like dioxygenase